jgi:hypothetical protein
MTIIFSIIGLLGFFKGRIYGRRGYYIEGNIAKAIGLTIFFIDMTPFLCICSSSIAPSLMTNFGIYTMFFSFILNMLILVFAFLFFGRRSE